MMPTPRTRRFRLILAGVDFSAPSAHALRYAAALARNCGGRVVALHAIDPLLEAAAATAYAARPLIRDTKSELARFAVKVLGAEAARHVDTAVTVGTPRLALMHEGARRHADVIVVGTNARGGVAKMFFGSTTEALLRRYHGAVLVVPPECAVPAPAWPHGNVVAAIGAGPHRRAMMSAAARVADVFGGWLTMIAPDQRLPRAAADGVPLLVLPLPDAARLRTFAQGTEAYEFVRTARVPVLVMRTGHRMGHLEPRPRAA